MSRLPLLSRDKLSTENQAIWDRVMSGRTGSGGPMGHSSMLRRLPRSWRRLKTTSVTTRSSPPRIRNS
jgi:hypothetical protein